MELYPHQTLSNVPARKFILADEQGLGKTVTALVYLQHKIPLLVVCKSALLENWYRECKTWLPDRTICKIGRESFNPRAGIYLVTFDVSARRQNLEIVHNKQLLMVAHRLKGVIIDEAHYIKNVQTIRSIGLLDIIRKTDDVIFLTGTPLVNDPKETAVLLEALGLGDGWNQFIQSIRKLPRKQQYDIAKRWLETNAIIRRTKRQLFPDFPEIERRFIRVNNCVTSPEQMGFGEIAKWRKLSGVAKVGEVAEYARQIGRKTVIFAHHKAVQDALVSLLQNCLYLLSDGDFERVERHKNLFQSSDKYPYIVCSLTADAEGHTLTAASDIIFAEMPWTETALQQAEARCYGRLNDLHGATSHIMMCNNSIDRKLRHKIMVKGAASSHLFS